MAAFQASTRAFDGLMNLIVVLMGGIKRNIPLRHAHLLCPGLVKDLHVRVHDLKKPLNAGESPLELLRKFDDPGPSPNSGSRSGS